MISSTRTMGDTSVLSCKIDTLLSRLVLCDEYYKNNCSLHDGFLNKYCVDCNTGHACCPKCVEKEHQDHLVIQIRKNTGFPSIAVNDINSYYDTRGIHVYKINGYNVLFLRIRPCKSRNGKEIGKHPCKICRRQIETSYETCSIECKFRLTEHPAGRDLPPLPEQPEKPRKTESCLKRKVCSRKDSTTDQSPVTRVRFEFNPDRNDGEKINEINNSNPVISGGAIDNGGISDRLLHKCKNSRRVKKTKRVRRFKDRVPPLQEDTSSSSHDNEILVVDLETKTFISSRRKRKAPVRAPFF